MQFIASADEYRGQRQVSDAPARAFWESRAILAALVLAAALPLLYPAVPPLVDLPGHMSQYHVERSVGTSPHLKNFYSFEWALIGNLGVDLLVIPMAKLFGLELGTKLIVMTIPMLTVAGFLALAREIHGRVPPTALFALPLAYHFPFQFGFLNFSLSAALCFLALTLWLRLGKAGRTRLRAALFVPVSLLIWICHTYGWGMFGLFAFAAELSARREREAGWARAIVQAGLACVPLALPFLLMLFWRSGAVEGDTGNWFMVAHKVRWLISTLHEYWLPWDLAGGAFLLGLALVAVRGRDLQLAAPMKVAVPLLFGVFLLMPWVVIGSGYADMRLAPFLVAAAIIGIQPVASHSHRTSALIAGAALLFFTARLLVTGFTFASIDHAWQRQLTAIEMIEPGSRVLTLTEVPCTSNWADSRMNHVNSFAVIRRDAFTNGQWAVAGAQMLKLRYTRGDPFVTDPSHLMRPPSCSDEPNKMEQAVEVLPKAFDYLWLIDVPPERWPRDARLVPIWRSETGILYRSARPAA